MVDDVLYAAFQQDFQNGHPVHRHGYGVVHRLKFHPQVGFQYPGDHGGGLRTGQGADRGEGAQGVGAGQNTCVIKPQHIGVIGVGKGGDGIDGGQAVLRPAGGQSQKGHKAAAGGGGDGGGNDPGRLLMAAQRLNGILQIGGVGIGPGPDGLHLGREDDGLPGELFPDAGGQSGRLAVGQDLLRLEAVVGAVHQSMLHTDGDIGGKPVVLLHVGEGGLCRQSGGKAKAEAQSPANQVPFHRLLFSEGVFAGRIIPPHRRVRPSGR